MRKFIWVVLLVGGALLSAYVAATHDDKGLAAAAAIMSVMTWIAYGSVTSHVFSLKRKVLRHLGTSRARTAVVTRTLSGRERVDVQVALDRLREESGGRHPPYGGPALSGLLATTVEAQPIVWESLPKSLTETHPCAAAALYLLGPRGRGAYCVHLAAGDGGGDLTLEAMARTREEADAAVERVVALARRRSVYRGSVVSLERSQAPRSRFPTRAQGPSYAIKFHDMPAAPRDAIVLPPAVMDVVERNVLGLLKHGDVLRASGRGTRHGVLFHGPPGTGKTLVTRYLANACAEYTVILLTGRQLDLIRESCQLAKMLAPSMVVLEDVDLVASERGRNRHNRVLHELLDEMDGLGSKSDCIFLLTTNRPDVLEPALAARPGRIDQAIYFPLPDLDCRRRLFDRYAAGLDLTAVDREPLLARTEGASPAFIEEFFRKAALMAAERGEHGTPLRVTDADCDRALRELLEFGGSLTQKLLGYGHPTRAAEPPRRG